MARTVVDSKPEKVLNEYTEIIDNVFNNSINYYYVQKKLVITIWLSIGHTFDPVLIEIKEMLVRL